MRVVARLERDTWTVGERADVVAHVTADESLHPGGTVEFQMPNSWSLVSGPSHTRAFQAQDPSGMHYIAVEAGTARFAIEIQPRQLNHPRGTARHGRHVIATLAEGKVPSGSPMLIRVGNTFAPDVAEGSDPYTYARQASALDFAAVADHWASLGREGYRILDAWNEAANIPGEFVTLPADERNPRGSTPCDYGQGLGDRHPDPGRTAALSVRNRRMLLAGAIAFSTSRDHGRLVRFRGPPGSILRVLRSCDPGTVELGGHGLDFACLDRLHDGRKLLNG